MADDLMPSRKRVPRPRPSWLDAVPDHLIPLVCVECSRWGGWDPARGLVIHPLGPACIVRVPQVDDEPTEVAA